MVFLHTYFTVCSNVNEMASIVSDTNMTDLDSKNVTTESTSTNITTNIQSFLISELNFNGNYDQLFCFNSIFSPFVI